VARRADLIVRVPGRGRCADNVQPVHIAACSKSQSGPVARPCEDAGFFQNADVAAVIRKKEVGAIIRIRQDMANLESQHYDLLQVKLDIFFSLGRCATCA